MVEDVCYPGSYLTICNSSFEKDCDMRIAKANTVYWKIEASVRNKHISLSLRVRLYQ